MPSVRISTYVVLSALGCLEAIEEFPLHSGQSRRGETEWSREVNEDGGLMVLVRHLHQYLQLILRALNIVCKPQWIYYLQDVDDGLNISMSGPGLCVPIRSTVSSMILIYDKQTYPPWSISYKCPLLSFKKKKRKIIINAITKAIPLPVNLSLIIVT